MDGKTKMKALEKAQAINNHIAYPDELLDNEKIEKFYEKLKISQDDYFQLASNVSLFEMNYVLSQLREPVNKSDWVTHAGSGTINAFYNPTENSMSKFFFNPRFL